MSSELRLHTKAARSIGPVTPESKAHSTRNARALPAQTCSSGGSSVLPNEPNNSLVFNKTPGIRRSNSDDFHSKTPDFHPKTAVFTPQKPVRRREVPSPKVA